MSTTTGDLRAVKKRRLGVFWIFAINGLILSTWLSRIPGLRDNLGVSTIEVGFFLFGTAAGALTGLAFVSHIVAWLGERRTILWFATLSVVVVGLVGVISVVIPSLVVATSAMFFFGVGASVADVAMNVEGADVEKKMSRNLMPWFHALFSLGTVTGGGISALASSLDIGVAIHFPVMALVLIGPTIYSVYLMGGPQGSTTDGDEPSTVGSRLAVWKEPRTVLIGIVALSMAFAEGSASDWLPLAMVDDRGYSNAQAALWFVAFTSAMTVGRIAGVPLLDRFGRVVVLRASAVAALIGISSVLLVPFLWANIVSVVLWGLGTALGFPVAMSAAADDPSRGPARVSAVATIAYAAFLIGPALIGGLTEFTSILTALWSVAILVFIGLLVTGATKPLPGGDSR